jgi:crotonobetainyl-CoA:carnitine CoA-transferase CaiB-like acyl-CoA transferase
MTGFARRPWTPKAEGPLAGLRVIDLSRLMAGNMLSLQLADFGADVVKVEPPEGDPLRAWTEEGESLFWAVYGRNKRSAVLDTRTDGGLRALKALVAQADVFIENFRPGTLEAMGVGPDALLAANPGLVVVRISGFGQTGPYAPQPGFGTLVEAMSGFAARTGFADREPVLPPLALADMITGLYGAQAVMAALLARQAGRAAGQVIDLSLLESMFSVLGPEAAIHARTGKVKARLGNASATTAPRNIYRCGDRRYLALSGSTPAVARRIFAAVGRADMADDPRFSTNAARVANRAEVDAVLGAWFAARPADEALAAMRAAGATVGPVMDIADILSDPHFRDREIVVEAEDPALGTVLMHDIVPRLSATPGVWRRPAPALGAHTAEVLAEAGIDLPEDAR